MTATGAPAAAVDVRGASLADLRSVDFRAADRNLFADEAALHDRLEQTLAGLDDAAWHLPGAAPSDAGGPDWSLAEHVGHIVDWQELAIDYVGLAIATGAWPSDDDYDGGDFDRYNERRRAPWTTMPAATIEARWANARPRLLELVRELGPEQVREHAAWGWVHMVLGGHYIDHLAVLEPWAEQLRARQVEGDPFVDDPRAADHAGFRDQDDLVEAQFDELIRDLPIAAWDAEPVTPGWTLLDHVGHLADWAEEAVDAIDVYHRRGHWLADPDEGVDPWNQRHVEATRAAGERPAEALARYDAARVALLAAIDTLSVDELRSPDGWSWAYDCLHGHTRKHLAMLGPWCVGRRSA